MSYYLSLAAQTLWRLPTQLRQLLPEWVGRLGEESVHEHLQQLRLLAQQAMRQQQRQQQVLLLQQPGQLVGTGDFRSAAYTPDIFLRDVRAGALQLAFKKGGSDFNWLVYYRRQSRDGSVQDGGAPHVLHLWNQADPVFEADKQVVKDSINRCQVNAPD